MLVSLKRKSSYQCRFSVKSGSQDRLLDLHCAKYKKKKKCRRFHVYPRVRPSVEISKLSDGHRLSSVLWVLTKHFSGCFCFEKYWRLPALYRIIFATSNFVRKRWALINIKIAISVFPNFQEMDAFWGKAISVRPFTFIISCIIKRISPKH